MYLVTTIIGVFVFSQHKKLREHIFFSDKEIIKYNDLLKEGKTIPPQEKMLTKFKKITSVSLEMQHEFDFSQFNEKFKHANTILTKYQLQHSVTSDHIMIQSMQVIDELDKSINLLMKRTREWVSLYAPRLTHKMDDHNALLHIIQKNIEQDDLGASPSVDIIDQIQSLASAIAILQKQREKKLTFLESVMKKYCPNVLAVAGCVIGAKLLQKAGSLRKMVLMPASTIQLLGAEKALFRHMITGAKPPRHGLIVNHPLIAQSTQKEHGKRARALADKISIAAKLDFFKGEFQGDKLLKDLEARFK